MTTLIEQYKTIKEKYKDAVLLFRVGDFYEIFGDDAATVSAHLEIMVIQTDENGEVKSMASLPFYSLDNALRILTKAGYRVAVCEQVEAPKAGPMKRGVTHTGEPEKPL